MLPKEGSFSAVVGGNKRRNAHLLVGAILTIGTLLIGSRLTTSKGLLDTLAWLVLGFIATFFYLRWQLRSQEDSPDAIKERVRELESELREQVQIRSYGARRNLIEDPLEELGLDIEPRIGWVRDPRLVKPISEKLAGIGAAFESSQRRLLIVGEPGGGKTMAAYSLIQYLDETEGEQRTPLLVNLSAWEAQESLEAFLVDYLCSSVGYQVRQRFVADAFIRSRRYSLILDGLDEIPARFRTHFAERLDEFIRGLPSESAVVVTCRTQEYVVLHKNYPQGLGLVQAVQILSLTEQQLGRAFAALAKRDKEWEIFLSQRYTQVYEQVRDLLSTPLFLNLAAVGHFRPDQLLDWSTTKQELRGLVLERYLNRTLTNQRQYEPADARRYLTWLARFLNGAEVSPFGLKTLDSTVFDLANLTPPNPPRGYRVVSGLVIALVSALAGLEAEWIFTGSTVNISSLVESLLGWLVYGLTFGLVWELGADLLSRWSSNRSALSSHLIFAWPSTRQQRYAFLRKARMGLGIGLLFGVVLGLYAAIGLPRQALITTLVFGLGVGLGVGLILALILALIETRPVLITFRTPTEAGSRSLFAALIFGLIPTLIIGLVLGGFYALTGRGLDEALFYTVNTAVVFGPIVGLVVGMSNGGWFVLLQKVAHRRLARAGKLPSRSGDFLEWGIEKQILRRVGSGVRFRHDFIQQHLANISEDVS